MAKYADPAGLDEALNYYGTATHQVACANQPADYADVSVQELAITAMDAADFTLEDGLVSGRRLVMAAKNGVAVTNAGTVTHVALVNQTDSKLLYVTTADPQDVTDGSFVDFPEWGIEIEDPQ